LEFELLPEGKIVPFEFIYPWKSLEKRKCSFCIFKLELVEILEKE
jgi:hypothetical protein